MKPIVQKKRNRPQPTPLEREEDDAKVFVCACGREQSAPEDPDEAVAFARQIGWRLNADGTCMCPFCAGGDNLAALKDVFEGRGKDRLS